MTASFGEISGAMTYSDEQWGHGRVFLLWSQF